MLVIGGSLDRTRPPQLAEAVAKTMPKAGYTEVRTGHYMAVQTPDLIFDHMYIERRMTPLNLYLRSATETAAEKAALDYGQCIRDLAYTNIFAGDLLDSHAAGCAFAAHEISARHDAAAQPFPRQAPRRKAAIIGCSPARGATDPSGSGEEERR